MPRGWFALLGCLAAGGCAGGQGSTTCNMVHVTDLKVTQRERAFYTTMTINGQNAEMLFDTGGEDNLLLESSARRLGLHVNSFGDLVLHGIGGTRHTGEARSPEVRLGEMHGENLTFATVTDDMYHGDEDGVLGMNFLYRYDMDLDFWGGRIGLYKALDGCGTPSVVMTQPLYAVPLTAPPGDPGLGVGALRPVVYVSINGTRLRALIDTGAEHSLIFRDTAQRAGLGTAEVIERSSGVGVGPRVVAEELRLSAPVVIGDLTIKNMPIVVADQRHDVGVDLLLGYDFVTKVHVWISRSSGALVMQYPPLATPAS